MGKKWKRILRLRRNAEQQVDATPPALEESAPKIEVAEVEVAEEAPREPVKVSASTTKTAKTKKTSKTAKAQKTTNRRTTKSK